MKVFRILCKTPHMEVSREISVSSHVPWILIPGSPMKVSYCDAINVAF